jgi:hypothetical protein
MGDGHGAAPWKCHASRAPVGFPQPYANGWRTDTAMVSYHGATMSYRAIVHILQ